MDSSKTTAEQIDIVPHRELSDDLLQVWSDIQQSTPLLESPFFRPEYTQAVAAIRDNVQVAVVHRDGLPVAFFPFQRRMKVRSRPVGSRLADYQGLIARPTFEIDPKQLLRACGLLSWRFYHVPVSQQSFAPFQMLTGRSPFVDATKLTAATANNGDHSYGKSRSPTRRKARKLERVLGPLRLEFANRDPRILDLLVRWKTASCRASRSYNALHQPLGARSR